MPAPGHPLHEALFHYYCEFDATGLLQRFAVPGLQPAPGLVTNFLGVRIPPKIHPAILDPMAGHLDGVPNPGNWHADIAEWSGALRAVEQAEDRFRIVELGCGWGCWLVNTGKAARNRGLAVDLVGIEGDRNHLLNAAETLRLNGFSDADFRLLHGVAGPKRGKALFPDPAAGTAQWGGEAIFYPDAETLRRGERDPGVQVLDCIPLEDVAEGKPIDLLHVDIQGAEADYAEGNFPAIARSVKRILIGTHNRGVEGRLETLFLKHGWRLEMERPAIAPPRRGRPEVMIDGVQMWVNPGLA